MRESLRRRWGRQPRYVCVICECVFRTDVLLFFKSLCRVFLTMEIRVSWTGPLPSCRFRVRRSVSPAPNLIALWFSLFVEFYCFSFWLQTSAPGELSWSSCLSNLALCAQCVRHCQQERGFSTSTWGHLSLWGAIWVRLILTNHVFNS